MIFLEDIRVTKSFEEWLKEQPKFYQKLIKDNPELKGHAYVRYMGQMYTDVDFKDLIPDGVKLYNSLKDK